MAVLVNRANGNWGTSSTWALVENSTWTNVLATQETGVTALTTAFQASATFTVATTQTLQGLLLKLGSRVTTAGNTVTVRIFNQTGGAAVANTTVTIDVLDMPNGIAWVYFKFPANATLATATTYRVELLSNVASSASFQRKNATAANWTFGLVTTTQQTPAATDQIIIAGENSAVGVFQTLTVTVDNTAATVFGPNVAGAAAIEVSGLGVIQYSTAAAVNTQLNLDGNLILNQDGIFRIGQSSAPIPSTSTAKLAFDNASNVQYGINVRTGGIFQTYGASKVGRTTLASTATAGATTISINDTATWNVLDQVAIASTVRSQIAQAEVVGLSAGGTGTSFAVSALANNHDGSASATAARADVINLTRNVTIQGVSTALQTYLTTAATCSVSCANTSFFFFGSGTAGLRGIEGNVTSGAFSFSGCAFAYFESASSVGIMLNAATCIASISDCVFYRQIVHAVGMAALITLSGNTVSVTDCVAIGGTGMGTTALYNLTVNAGVYTNLAGANGSVSAFIIQSTAITPSLSASNWRAYVCTSSNIQINTISENTQSNALFSNISSWRSAAEGILLGSSTTGACINTMLDGGRLFGNATRGLSIGFCFSTFVENMLIYNEALYDQPNGIAFNNHLENVYFDSCQLGVVLPHSVSDVRDVCPRNEHNATFRNCLFGSTTEFSNQSLYTPGSAVGSSRHEQTAGVQKMFKKFGTITLDSTFYKVAAPSQRLTPTDANNKLLSQEKRIAVPNGQAAQVSVWVRKSVIGDGTAYNGNEVQIKVLADPALGIANDTVLATSSSYAFGDFEKITGTSPVVTDNGVIRLVATCDGTAGWVNVDLWTVAIV